MVEKDLFAELDKSQLPVMSNFNPAFLNPAFDPDNKYSLPYQGGSTGIVYNSETIKTPPTSYTDLWNAEYAGRIIAVDDSRTMITLTLLELGYDANSTDPAQLSEAKTKLKELTANVRIFDSDSPKTALIGGEADLGVIWSTEVEARDARDVRSCRRRLRLAKLPEPSRRLLDGHARPLRLESQCRRSGIRQSQSARCVCRLHAIQHQQCPCRSCDERSLAQIPHPRKRIHL